MCKDLFQEIEWRRRCRTELWQRGPSMMPRTDRMVLRSHSETEIHLTSRRSCCRTIREPIATHSLKITIVIIIIIIIKLINSNSSSSNSSNINWSSHKFVAYLLHEKIYTLQKATVKSNSDRRDALSVCCNYWRWEQLSVSEITDNFNKGDKWWINVCTRIMRQRARRGLNGWSWLSNIVTNYGHYYRHWTLVSARIVELPSLFCSYQGQWKHQGCQVKSSSL